MGDSSYIDNIVAPPVHGGELYYQEFIGCEGGMFYTAPGRWFKYKSEGGPVTVSTCEEGTTVKDGILQGNECLSLMQQDLL
jgi:hypothetical protein